MPRITYWNQIYEEQIVRVIFESFSLLEVSNITDMLILLNSERKQDYRYSQKTLFVVHRIWRPTSEESGDERTDWLS
jgi:hypothetical protein